MKFFVSHSLLFFIAFSTIGCGSGNVPVHGKVTFSDDQSPVSGMVYFQDGGYLARGALQKDGSYILGSVKATDGLPPGTYSVYIQENPIIAGTTAGGEPIFENIVDEKFADPSKSGLIFEAGKGENRFDFQVDRKQKQKRK